MQDELDIHKDFMHSMDILITNLIDSFIDTPDKGIHTYQAKPWSYVNSSCDISVFVNAFHYEKSFYSDGLIQRTLLSNRSLVYKKCSN